MWVGGWIGAEAYGGERGKRRMRGAREGRERGEGSWSDL